MIEKIRKIFTNTSLKSRVLKGGFWLGLGGSFEYGLRFLRNIILARILAPEAFGLMAIILAVNAALESFTQIGIKEAIIQSPDGEEDSYLNGAWWLSFVRAIGLFAIAMLSVPFIASFYNVPQNTIMFRISFFTILFNGTLSARAYIAQKKMDYKPWVIISSGGGTIGILAAIGLSLWLHSVWALVIGYVLEAAARCFISFIVCPFLPRLQFRKEHSQALITFSRGMFGLPILLFVFTQADIFVVGKLLSKKELGLYSMALSLAQLPIFLVSTIINPILMPVFSEKQHDKDWINRTLMLSTRIIVLAGTPVACFMALYGRNLLTIIYGHEYVSVAIPFAILLGSTILRAASNPIANVYLAVGQPQLQRYFTGIRAVLMTLMIYPAVKLFGLTGAASAGLIAMIFGYIVQIVRVQAVTNLDTVKYGMIFLHGLLLSLLVIIVWSVAHQTASAPLHDILIGLISCVALYGIVGVVTRRFKQHVCLTRLQWRLRG
ncbi:MAG: Membrane protein involved in the export of O-antigen and teichoic acid [Candidatus Magasanikbacteria bacterium GW2011_GWC2_37_14]|uniref:Membrane protein involved in the export of O-antigen and teichoic acid n=1 Tax=Candidatus Magasanikbacteria bacterium GW2011_GWC2_37_14 TaxID=1619046 RepID=A0A0G0IRG3_9BACT|nr:MAG: Membrane protein involved in the export of O-antigen and teichoic acid [Candidatus Magasanikbacteria bacterium GW2011_GWC2_37_14]OGL49818.1 MAG: hypothetical protein A3C43_03170 [Candidatus Schekmanbacteria bacterium RIFCSPHIGHO2_02_FULL_38_11]